jgi:hypothetical protein
MEDVHEQARADQARAWEVIRETGVVEIWRDLGAEINLVGSLRTGLLIAHRDIDFHLYTDPFDLRIGFEAMGRLAQDQRIVKVTYGNMLEAEGCVEWHAWFQAAPEETWQLDIIHLRRDSAYAGHMERVAERIVATLTEETRDAILAIKRDLPPQPKIMGIEVYRAVMGDGVRTLAEMLAWKKRHGEAAVLDWMP